LGDDGRPIATLYGRNFKRGSSFFPVSWYVASGAGSYLIPYVVQLQCRFVLAGSLVCREES